MRVSSNLARPLARSYARLTSRSCSIADLKPMSSSYRSDVMPTKLPAPSSSMLLTAITRSRPPRAVAASLMTCCSGVCAAAGSSRVQARAAIAPRTTLRVHLLVSIFIQHLRKTEQSRVVPTRSHGSYCPPPISGGAAARCCVMVMVSSMNSPCGTRDGDLRFGLLEPRTRLSARRFGRRG